MMEADSQWYDFVGSGSGRWSRERVKVTKWRPLRFDHWFLSSQLMDAEPVVSFQVFFCVFGCRVIVGSYLQMISLQGSFCWGILWRWRDLEAFSRLDVGRRLDWDTEWDIFFWSWWSCLPFTSIYQAFTQSHSTCRTTSWYSMFSYLFRVFFCTSPAVRFDGEAGWSYACRQGVHVGTSGADCILANWDDDRNMQI